MNANNFIGTTISEDFRIRTNNVERMVITADGRAGLGATAPLFHLDMRYTNNTNYSTVLSGNGLWDNSDGLFIYNSNNGANNGNLNQRSTAITLGCRHNSSLSIAKINAVGTGEGSSAITFQTENSGPGIDQIRERVRITPTGTLEVNVQNFNDNMLAFHSIGAVRMQSLPTCEGRGLVIDGNGNVFVRSNNVRVDHSDDQSEQINKLEERISLLENQLNQVLSQQVINRVLTNDDNSLLSGCIQLSQNKPNPARDETIINYAIDRDFSTAQIQILDASGKIVQAIQVENKSGTIHLNISGIAKGIYFYSLLIDQTVHETKRLIKK